jgi:hypothetical protein
MKAELMSLHEALDVVYAKCGPTYTYLLLRQAVRALSEEQVREIEAPTEGHGHEG